ncbi:MBL fold metallo-hydrolase [Salipaludibacillus daqingensis]|uniref:MBL fold metallo-hydrolase n=1 Tax=Salipaludibacillus daqingensis TaxID=3041001 RepID=UPI002476AF7C|nr:MBL fold metallo-hydrolase [Salipaludibacillus daqingensis]
MTTSLKKRSKEIYQITLPTPFLVGPINTYLIFGDALTLVDTGPLTDEALYQMKRQLAELNLSLNDIELVVLTHHHPDHIGLVQKFLPNAKVVGHPKLKPWLEKDEKFLTNTRAYFRRFYKENGVPEQWIEEMDRINRYYMAYTERASLDTELIENDSIEGIPGWTVLETPGHAQSHISLLHEKNSTMIAGDHLIAHISSNAIVEAPYWNEQKRPKTLLQYRDALEKCKGARMIYSGHGDAIDKPKELIEKRLRAMEEKAQVFKRKMGNDPFQVFQLSKQLYPKIYEKQTALTFSETLGHIDMLEEQGEVSSYKEGNAVYYQKT